VSQFECREKGEKGTLRTPLAHFSEALVELGPSVPRGCLVVLILDAPPSRKEATI
jgi:hypothetical protein